jgi:hypothetical protein
MYSIERHIQVCSSLELKTQTRFSPVSLSLSMARVLLYIRLDGLARDKQCSLLGPFHYEENELL